MKSSRKEAQKKQPRVLANVVKRSGKSVNSSGNLSFLSKSSANPYIADLRKNNADLRRNNAKLALALANERSKVGAIFHQHQESQAAFMEHKATIRDVSRTIDAGISKFNNALDHMIEASSLWAKARDTVVRLCPELANIEAVANRSTVNCNSLNLSPTAESDSPNICPPVRDCVNQVKSPKQDLSFTSLSKNRQCAARPMVQGQVISNLTIPLQRVTVPAVTRHLGKGTLKPTRGVLLDTQTDERTSRLSNVSEEANESQVRSPQRSEATHSSASRRSESASSPTTSKLITLPPSHVLLERITPDISYQPKELSPKLNSDDEQLTVVHFGSINFSSSFSPNRSSPKNSLVSSPLKTSCLSASPTELSDASSAKNATSPVVNHLNGGMTTSDPPDPQAILNLNNGDEYESDSSSDDEDIALQIVESKRHYLGNPRQADCMEGTSWNYDERGKFRSQPSKKRKLKNPSNIQRNVTTRGSGRANFCKQDDQEITLSSGGGGAKVSFQPEEEMPKVSGDPVLDFETINVDHGSSDVFNNSVKNRSPLFTGGDNLTDTILEEQEMSFTNCVSSVPLSLISELSKAASGRTEENLKEDDARDSDVKESCSQELSDRRAFITHRSQSRKHPSIQAGQMDSNRCDASPTSSLAREQNGQHVENNRSSPIRHAPQNTKSVRLKKKTIHMKNQELSQKPSVVVLERLPSYVTLGSPFQLSTSNLENVSSESRSKRSKKRNALTANLEESATFPGGRNSNASPVRKSPNPPRKPPTIEQGTRDCHDKNTSFKQNMPINKPGPKSAKEKRKKLENDQSQKDSSFGGCAISLSTDAQSAPSSPLSSGCVSWTQSEEGLSSDAHRPRRQKAPVSLKEPSLNKKLRRE